MEKKKQPQSKITFEKALGELEEIALRLEGGDLGLDESIAEFEKGLKLARFCNSKLEEAERKIEILQKGKGKTIEKKQVSVDHDTGEINEDEDMQGSLL